MRVDFPAPCSPTRAWTSPWFRVKSTSFKANTPGNDLKMCFISSSGIGGIAVTSSTTLNSKIVLFLKKTAFD
jgi:hypothetical protein